MLLALHRVLRENYPMKQAFPLSLLLLVFLSSANIGRAAVAPCAKDQTLSCLKANFPALYRDNFPLYFTIIQKARDQATLCKGKETADFLELATVVQGNLHASKYFYANVEQALVRNRTQCFLKAYRSLTPAVRKALAQDIRAPRHVAKAQLHDALSHFAQKPEFKGIVKEILGAR